MRLKSFGFVGVFGASRLGSLEPAPKRSESLSNTPSTILIIWLLLHNTAARDASSSVLLYHSSFWWLCVVVQRLSTEPSSRIRKSAL